MFGRSINKAVLPDSLAGFQASVIGRFSSVPRGQGALSGEDAFQLAWSTRSEFWYRTSAFSLGFWLTLFVSKARAWEIPSLALNMSQNSTGTYSSKRAKLGGFEDASVFPGRAV